MDDILIIKERLKELLFQNAPVNADGIFDRLSADADGCLFWNDIDYSCQLRGPWKNSEHLDRLCLALKSKGKSGLEADKVYRDTAIAVLRYWLKNDFTNPNWWHNEIGTPTGIAAAVFMLEPYLVEADKSKAVEIIARGSMKCCENARRQSGANLLWSASVTLKHALLTSDKELLSYAISRVQDEFAVGIEGIQEDGSFYQHGYRWYSGGYGRSFTVEAVFFIYLADSTCFEFKKENLEIFQKLVLDGQRKMMHKGVFDYGATGREFTRKRGLFSGDFINALKLLSLCKGLSRSEEIIEFYRELSENGGCKASTSYFHKINVLSTKSDEYYLSARGTGPRLAGAEHCNGEGMLCYNMSYGTNTCFMHTGKEYYEIAPLWDYSKIPGTTAREETDEQLLNHGDWHIKTLSDTVSFGKAEKNSGIYSQRFTHEDISLTASYFLHNGCIVALGSDISDASPEKGRIFTTVEQCFSEHSDIISQEAVSNGGFIYRNLDENTIFSTDISEKQGSYSRNNTAMPYDAVSGTLFTVTIPYSSGYGKYAYAVYPKSRGCSEAIKVLRNDGICQAVEFSDGKILAVFHIDGTFSHDSIVYKGKTGEMLFI